MDSITSLELRPWFTLGVTLLLGAFLSQRLERLIRLRHINGPLLSKVTGIPHILALLSDNCQDWYLGLNQKYGELVAISPTTLLTSSPDLWTRMNTHPGYTRAEWYYRAIRFDWRKDNIVTQLDTEKHDMRRKQMVRGYSGAENLTLEVDIEACVLKLLHLVRSRYANKRKVMDLPEKIQYFTLDTISTIGFGKCFNLMNADEDPNEYLTSNHAGLKVCNRQVALGTSWVNRIPFLSPKTDLDIEKTKGFYKMTAMNAAMVEAREKEFHEQKSRGVVPRADMLTSFMKNGISGVDLQVENVLQIVAGADTTGAALKGVFVCVLTNPRVYKALQAEIHEAVESGMAPRAPGIIRFSQAKELVYLQAVIKEAIRVYSPVNNQLARNTPPGGDTVTIDGKEMYIPGGLTVVPSFKAMHRNKNVYGKDSDVDIFRPERWIEEKDQTKLAAMKNEHNLTFGHGRWQCLGKTIALRELSIVVFELFRHFDWAVASPDMPWKDVNLIGVHVTTGMYVQVDERK